MKAADDPRFRHLICALTPIAEGATQQRVIHYVEQQLGEARGRALAQQIPALLDALDAHLLQQSGLALLQQHPDMLASTLADYAGPLQPLLPQLLQLVIEGSLGDTARFDAVKKSATPATESPRFPPEILIIGSGAGGATIAWLLAQAGIRSLVLERGRRHTLTDYQQDELVAQHSAMFTPAVDDAPHALTTRRSPEPVLSPIGWTASCVGGGTEHMGGYFYRFFPVDFEMASRFGGSDDVVDWPYSYAELEPFYGEAEHLVGVSGYAGSGAPSRSTAYPMPPLPGHPLFGRLAEACRQRGWQPEVTPRAANSHHYQGRPACQLCDRCAGFGCPVGARGSAQSALLARAEASGYCQVLANAEVDELTVDRRGWANGAWYRDSGGQRHYLAAAVVCLSASAVESARLLLASPSGLFPAGLGNHNGRVGKHLQFHATTMGTVQLPESLWGTEGKAWQSHIGLSVFDHYELPAGVAPLAKGGVLRFDFASASAISQAEQWLLRQSQPAYGHALSKALADNQHNRYLMFEAFHDFLPNPGTFVSLDPSLHDRYGRPLARIQLEVPAQHRAVGAYLAAEALELMTSIGGHTPWIDRLGGTSAYLVHGTCRAGTDPDRTVLDPWCRSHSVPNLFVIDGSFMPTAGGAAPTLTIIANAIRAGRHLIGLLRTGELSQRPRQAATAI